MGAELGETPHHGEDHGMRNARCAQFGMAWAEVVGTGRTTLNFVD
jgi:hypothetical protein